MKRFFYLSLVLILTMIYSVSLAEGQNITYSDSWGKAGYSLKHSARSGVTINYSINEFSIETQQINRENLQVVTMPGSWLPNDEGAPNLPGQGRYIAIPEGSTPVLNIVNFRTETIQNIDMAPAPRIPLETEDGPLDYNKNPKIYDKDAFYPAQPVKLSDIMQIRGVDVVILGITPYQYNPVTKELIVYRDIEVEVSFEGGTGYFGEDRLRSRWFDPILTDMILNRDQLPKIDYNKQHQSVTREDGAEYLIVTPDGEEFQQWADSIKAFRTLQGISTKIVTLSEIGGNTPTILENYFNSAYQEWTIPPVAVLLMGDYGSNMENSITSPIWDNYCVSDNIFADVDNDDMAEMIFARMTANNDEELRTMVTKFLDYERNPPTNPDFYNHPITALGWQTERWFQICSETVGGYFRNVHGKDPIRINAIYGGNPNNDPWSTATNTQWVLDYFGPNGLGYIPASPSELGGWSGGSSADVTAAINDGAFILQHRDHGGETGWGEPDYDNGDINNLVNTDLTFVFSINCLTGKYNWSNECFTEKFHRHTKNGYNSGALGLIAASEVSYSFVNDTYVWGMYDNMWPDFMPDYEMPPEPRGQFPAFGNVSGKYFLQFSQWPYNTSNKEVTYNLFHHHGDAFLRLYSEVPQDLSVTHNPILYSGESTFTVSADEGSFIALTVNGEIIGTSEGTGFPVNIDIEPQLPPNQMIVTITGQNYYRYTSVVDVIPPEGPYVVFDSYAVNDEAGNGNGDIDFGETIMLDMTTRNVGVEEAVEVSVALDSEDEYITITDGDEVFGNIEPDGYSTVDNAFTFDVSDSIPDGHKVNFTVEASDANDSVWVSYFSVTTMAPVLEVGNYEILDPTGNNNGRLDPGETVDVVVTVMNDGHSTALETMSTLGTSSGLITINSGTFELGDIPAEGTVEATFNITADAGAQVGSMAELFFNVESGYYTAQKTFVSKIGLILEDFETGDFSSFDWTHSGNADWTITQENPYEGMYCAKSGAIGNSSTTQLMVFYEVMGDDSISFFRKVSTEAGYDYLEFYIDNIKVDQWAGEHGWERFAYPIEAGPHMFKWVYDKDYYVTGGQDCAWLDYISLPPELSTTAYAGPDMDICEDEDCPLDGSATYYDELTWTTAGDGTFDDPYILDPIYTPGTGDIEAGEVTLTITVYGSTATETDEMVVSLHGMPVVWAGDDYAICADETFINMGAVAENCTSVLWETGGDGYFVDPSILNASYIPGELDIENGAVLLVLHGSNEGCDGAGDDIYLTINSLPEPVVTGNDMVCQNTDGYLYSTPEVAGCFYEWEVTGGLILEGQNTSEISITWEEMGDAMISVTETNTETGCAATYEFPVYVNASPEPMVSGIEEICIGETEVMYSTQMVEGDTYMWNITGGTITSGEETNEIYVTWDMAGEGTISVTETITETGCQAENMMVVMVNDLPEIAVIDTTICHNHEITLDAGNPDAQSWTWSTGETTQTILIDSTGVGYQGTKELSVEVVSADGCVAEKDIIVTITDCSGINEFAESIDVSLYPNPNSGVFSLELSAENHATFDIIIVDVTGSVVYESNNHSVTGKEVINISVSTLPEGMYYLRLNGENGNIVKKIVIQK